MKKLFTYFLRFKEKMHRIEAQQLQIMHFTKELSDDIKMNQGMILSKLNANLTSKNIQDYEFKVFSQWGEDGILQFLINAIEIKNKTFIEFGVESFHESNCRFLMMKDNWRGFVIDGSEQNIKKLQESSFYWKYHLEATHAFITKENINNLLLKSGFEQDLGILSIDIDGNDFYILEAINFYKPRIIICEYNSVFGPDRKISIPYKEDFFRTTSHYSNLYWGASLPAFVHLANNKGYAFVGTNSTGLNAFFVRQDLVNDKLNVLTAHEVHFVAKFRDALNRDGKQIFPSQEEKYEMIKGLPVVNIENNCHEFL